MTRLPSLRRAAVATLSLPLTAVVCLAPLPALADGSIADASYQLRSPLTTAPLGAKMRMYVTLQDPVEGEAAAAPPTGAEGPAPAPSYPPPPPPGYGAPPPSNPPPRGIGLLVSGAVVTGAVALPMLIGGVYIVAIGRAANNSTDGVEGDIAETGTNFLGGFFLVFGILALGAGVPMLAIGGVRMKRYNDWKSGQQVRLLPHSGRTAHGTWTAGLKLQF